MLADSDGDEIISAEVYLERLCVLKQYILDLDPKLWYFNTFVKEVNDCGTVGCALGHCPNIWPDYWQYFDSVVKFNGRGRPDWCLMTRSGGTKLSDLIEFASEFFGITENESWETFWGHNYRETVTKEQFVERLNILIEKYSAGVDQ